MTKDQKKLKEKLVTMYQYKPNKTYSLSGILGDPNYEGQTFTTDSRGNIISFKSKEEKEAEESKKMWNEVIKADQKSQIKIAVKRQREEQELKESPEMQSEEFAEKKQGLQNAYVDLITTTKTDARNRKVSYNPDSLITTQPKFYKEYNKVINAEKELNKVTKKLSRLRGDSVYSDSLNIVRELLGDDTNFSAQLPGKPIQPKEVEEVPQESTPVDARRYFNPYTRSGATSSIEIPETKSVEQRNTLETQPQPLPPVLQPKKSTQDADRKKKISDEELKRILGS
tara:strand:- start:7943 stop:8794 length:852 start_codon:yes stop_codon:yes gene_type:complete